MYGFVAVVCFAACGVAGDGEKEFYSGRIVAPAELSADAEAAVVDLLHYLPRVTDREFLRTTDVAGGGIILVRASDGGVPAAAAAKLEKLGPEAFCIWPDDARLWIVANSDAGLAHGALEYLERLGVRWYHASDHWTIVPHRDDIRPHEAIVASPAFRSRNFYGSGGFGPASPRDPDRRLMARWHAWQRRNRFGGEFQLAGHSGEAFNTKHRAQLEAHPEYRALVDGKRAEWWLAGKFCLSNPEVMRLYVEDRLASYRQQRKLDPGGRRSWAVSVEPADGGGHCECDDCKKLGSVSDRVFHTANVVARALRSEFPDGFVSLYAYNEHAAVPAIDIEPNVYVAVIPYGFQRTDLSPEQLIDAWARKVPQLAIYDYWSIPDWTHDAPTFDPLVGGPERLRSWHRRGVNGFSIESTFSGGAMGPAWWIASRLAWDPARDAEALLVEYCRDCFGPGAAPIERMLRRWSQGYWPTSHESALSFRDVDEAWRLAEGDVACTARIADMARYVEYLRLLHAYDCAKYRSEERYGAAVALADYGWSIYDSAMVHAFRHGQLLGRDESPTHPEIRDRFDPKNPAAPGWAVSAQLTDEQVRSRLNEGLKQLEPLAFVVRRYGGSLRRAVETQPAATPDYGPILWPGSSQTIDFEVSEGASSFALRLSLEKAIRMTVSDDAGQVVLTRLIEPGVGGLTDWRDVAVEVPQAGKYRMQLWSPKRMFGLQWPSAVPHSLAGWVNSQGRPTPRLYFYVPRDVERIAIFTRYTAAGPPRFFQSRGSEVAPTFVDGGRLMLIDVPAEERGRIWSLDKAKCPNEPLQMLNAPNCFAFSPEALLVPEDALATGDRR